MPYRVIKDGVTVLDLRDWQHFRLGDTHYPANHIQRGGTVDGYTVEQYVPDPPAPYVPDPADIALTPAQFFEAVDVMAGLTPADPQPDVWMQEAVAASTVLSPPEKRQALILLRKAQAFERAHPFMDALGAAILGKSPAELDQAFLDKWQQANSAP